MLLLHFSIISCRRCFVKNSTLKYAAKLFCSQILSYRDRCLRCFTHVLIACFNTTHPQSCTTSIHNLFNWSVSSNFHLIWTGWSRPQIRGFNEKFSEWCGRFGEETSGNERVKVQSFFSREASLASLSGINRHLGNIVFVNGRKSIEKRRIALKSPTMLYPSKKAEPQKTSNHMMTEHWEYFPSFTCFLYFLMFRRCAVTSLLSFEQRTSSAAVWRGWLLIIGLKMLPSA